MSDSSFLSDYLIPISIAIGLSLLVSMNLRKATFSVYVFLASIVISIGVLIWIGIIPYYSAVIAALAIVGMLFMESGDSDE